MVKLEVGKHYKTREGEKVGPMRLYNNGFFDVSDTGPHRNWFWDGDGTGIGSPGIIAEWPEEPTGPVLTVTRKEIVPGVYGALTVEREGLYRIMTSDPTELRAAIATLTEIADAIEP